MLVVACNGCNVVVLFTGRSMALCRDSTCRIHGEFLERTRQVFYPYHVSVALEWSPSSMEVGAQRRKKRVGKLEWIASLKVSLGVVVGWRKIIRWRFPIMVQREDVGTILLKVHCFIERVSGNSEDLGDCND